MTSFGFDTSSVKPSEAFDPLPAGWYAMRIYKAELVDGKKAGVGQMLKVTFEIVEHAHPDYAGRKVFANFCHMHDNEQTRDIARGQIAAILVAIGKKGSNEVDAILGGELRVKLACQPAKDGYDARNEAKGFKALSEVVEPAGQQAHAATAQPQAATAPKSQPWKR